MKNMNHFSIYSILTCPYNNLKIRKIITSLSIFAATVSSRRARILSILLINVSPVYSACSTQYIIN